MSTKVFGYTLAEVIVVMLIIAVIVAVSIGITKTKLDNIVSYTYYNTYSTLRKISTEMLADWDPTDPEYKDQVSNSDKSLFANLQTSKLALSDNFLKSVLEFPNDRRFFSTLISHIPFSIKYNPEKVKAGTSVTVYGCPESATSYTLGSPIKDSSLKYYFGYGKCMSSSMISLYDPDSYLKCPGTFKGLATYAQHAPTGSSHKYYFCTNECSTMKVCDTYHADPTGTCQCGSKSDYESISCSDAKWMFSSNVFGSGDEQYLGSTTVSNATIISRTLTTGNVCKLQIQCDDGFYWESKGTNHGYPIGSCKSCSKTCSLGFTLNKSTCSCECKKTCSEGYKLNTSTCSCVKDGGTGACNKTCSGSGQKLDTETCECYVECWDGSRKEYSFQCPSKVTCWDGSIVHSQSECPACTNKPATIACGYKWDEKTCKLTGSEKNVI